MAANRPAALGKRCAECHTPEYAGLLATWTAKLDALAGGSALEPALAERLRRSGAHNFALAHEPARRTQALSAHPPGALVATGAKRDTARA